MSLLTDEELGSMAAGILGYAALLPEQMAVFTDIARQVEAATAAKYAERIASLERDLQFVERWANHHGAKPHVTAEEALSVIQHYPGITAITNGYADGKVPDTPNPWAKVAELERELEGVRVDGDRYRLLRLKVYIDPKELILRTRDVFLTRGATVPEMLDSALDAMRTGEPT